MGKTTIKYLGHKEGHMISKLEENLGATDIKNFTVSPLYQIKCISAISATEFSASTKTKFGICTFLVYFQKKSFPIVESGIVWIWL